MKLKEKHNTYEAAVYKILGPAIKTLSIDLSYVLRDERENPYGVRFGHPTRLRLSTLILKRGYRNRGIGSKIISYLKAICNHDEIDLIIPFGQTRERERLRNFYIKNGLTQKFINDFEYFIYKPIKNKDYEYKKRHHH